MCGDGHGGIHGMSGPMWMPELEPTLGRILAFHPQPIPLFPLLGLLMLGGYLYAVRRLAKRGVRWPWFKTAAWVLGTLLVLATTVTGIEGYGMMLFSVHMVQHMVLTMVAPILLLVGAPVTLALRALPTQGPRAGARRFLVWLLASRFFKVVCSSPVRWFVFLSGLYGIYFTPLFDQLMSNVWGHNFMLLHFIVSGYLFFGPLVAADPWPGSTSPLFRLLETFLSIPFHAFFGIAIMSANEPIVTFFNDPPLWWRVDLMQDQYLAGGIVWVTSELPTLLLLVVILLHWWHSDSRDAVRHDRSERRTNDAELESYNRWLAGMSGAATAPEPEDTAGTTPAGQFSGESRS